jgi:hypothetical protein
MDIEKALSEATGLLQRGNIREARDVPRGILAEDKYNENAWTLFSKASATTRDEIFCLENVLKLNP